MEIIKSGFFIMHVRRILSSSVSLRYSRFLVKRFSALHTIRLCYNFRDGVFSVRRNIQRGRCEFISPAAAFNFHCNLKSRSYQKTYKIAAARPSHARFARHG